MTFFCLSLVSLFAGFGLGFAKFFLLSYLSTETFNEADKVWIIQLVGSVITLGPCLVYPVSGPLAAAFRKRWLMLGGGTATAFFFLLGSIMNWPGTPWLYLFMTGFLMGIFNSAKNAAVPLEAVHTGRSTEAINGTLNILYIGGLLAGVPAGTELYYSFEKWGGVVGALVFVVAAIAGAAVSYAREDEHRVAFATAFFRLKDESFALVRKYPAYLLADPFLWGIASATSLAVTAYSEERNLGTALESSLMSVFAVFGVALGNGVAAKLHSIRYRAAAVATVVMAGIIIVIPLIVEAMRPAADIAQNHSIYLAVASLVLVYGVFFGICTNLVEADYLSAVYSDREEGTGAALLSASTAFFPFFLGGLMGLSIIKHWISATSQFIWMGGGTLIAAVVIFRLARRKMCEQIASRGGEM